MGTIHLRRLAILAILGIGHVLCQDPDPCLTARQLNSTSSSRNPYVDLGNGSLPLCDSDLFSADEWIRFYEDAGSENKGHHIPEQCVESPKCGTESPIWMNGTHPSQSFPGPVNATACMSTSNKSCCDWEALIQVKWCDPGYFVYKLESPPNCSAAYCFDDGAVDPYLLYPPIDIPSIRDPFISDWKMTKGYYPKDDETRTLTLGKINATVFSIGCAVTFLNGSLDDDIVKYGLPVIEIDLVTREEDGTLTSILGFKQNNLNETEYMIMEKYLHCHLDKPIMCRTVAYWDRTPQNKVTLYSTEIRLEFQLKTGINGTALGNNITLIENEQLTFWVAPNFPVTSYSCYVHNNDTESNNTGSHCYAFYNIYLKPDDCPVGTLPDNCRIVLHPSMAYPRDGYSDTSKITVSSIVTAGTMINADFYMLNFGPITNFNDTNPLFCNYTIPPIRINTVKNCTRPRCCSTGDPHIMPFYPGLRYDVYSQVGYFYLLRLRGESSRTLEVQVQHRRCSIVASNPNVVCNCGVYVREGNNVIGISICDNPSNTNNTCTANIVKYQTVTNDSNGFILPEPSLEESTNEWTITLLSGVEITVKCDSRGFLSICILGLNNDDYLGLCSSLATVNNVEYERVPSNESLFCQPAECVDEELWMNQCDCSSNSTDNIFYTCKSGVTLPSPSLPPLATLRPANFSVCSRNVTVTVHRGNSQGILYSDVSNGTYDIGADNYSITVDNELLYPPKCDQPALPLENLELLWPTPNKRITQTQAERKCQSVFEQSPVYQLCRDHVDTAGMLYDCISDIQITELLDVANSYQSHFEGTCLQICSAQPTCTDNVQSNIDLCAKVRALLCPGYCTYNNEVRGTCVNGACQCFPGFTGRDCSQTFAPPGPPKLKAECVDTRSISLATLQLTALIITTNVGSHPFIRTVICTEGNVVPPVVQVTQGVVAAGGLLATTISLQDLSKAVYYINISISNDNVNYTQNVTLILYDGACMNCSNAENFILQDGKYTRNGACSTVIDNECDKWDILENTVSGCLEEYPTITSLQSCQDYCERWSYCSAINVPRDKSKFQCLLSVDKVCTDATRKKVQDYDQHVLRRCLKQCQDQSYQYPGYRSDGGGAKQLGITSVEGCKAFCANDPTCVGLDFNTISKICSTFYNIKSMNTKRRKDISGTDNFVQLKPSDCKRAKFTKKPGVKSGGGYEENSVTTLEDCLKYCVEDPACVAIDWDQSGKNPKCTVHEDGKDLSKQKLDPKSDQYIIDRY